MEAAKIFAPGKHFAKVRALSAGLNAVVALLFYFIYDYLLGEAAGTLLLPLFLCLAAAVAALTWKLTGRMAAGIRYEVGQTGLGITLGHRSRLVPWQDITELGTDRFKMFDVFPAYIRVNGEKEGLSQTVEELYELVWEISRHLGPDAKQDPDTVKTAQNMRGVR